MDKGGPQKMSVIEKFKKGIIDKFTVPVDLKPKKKPKGEIRKGHKIRWLSHAEMLMHHKRIKRRRRRNEIAKMSRRRNRAA